MSAADDRLRLADVGQIYVTLDAAETYARALDVRVETARRVLTEALLDAHPVEGTRDGDTEQWRRRSRRLGVDIQARVSYEGDLCVVVHVYVRSASNPHRDRARDEKRERTRR